MAYSLLFVVILFALFLLAVLGSLIVIGLAVKRARINQNRKQPDPAKDLDQEQVDEITSTYHLLNH
jgi:hypothetical protein